jgi:O-succinylbenzoic acid--CoA ligase
MECLVSKTARTRPDDPYIIDASGKEISYRQAELIIAEQAHYLKEHWCDAQNQFIAYWAHPTVRTILLIHALFRSGLIGIPVNPKLPPAAVKKMLQDIGCQVLIDENLSDDIARAVPQNRFLEFQPPRRRSLIFSSGSTAEPKAIVHGYENHVAAATASHLAIPLTPRDRWLLSLPLHHVSGFAILFRTALAGATVVLQQKDEPLLESMVRQRVSHSSLVPFQLADCLRDKTAPVVAPQLKSVLVGGSAVPRQLLAEAVTMGWPICYSYGMSEMASTVAVSEVSNDGSIIFDTPLPGIEWEMIDGEIWVRGESLCLGYWQNGTLTKASNQDGWFQTGDLGRFNTAHELEIVGRKDHMFISGGENIYPEEIENALMSIPGMERAFVCAVADGRYGKRPAALVSTERHGDVLEDEIKKELSKTLPRIKIPDFIFSWPRDERVISLKTNRRHLQGIVENLIPKLF